MHKRLAVSLIVFATAALAACNDVRSPTFVPDLQQIQICQTVGGVCPTGPACLPRPEQVPSLVAAGREIELCAVGLYEGLFSPDDNLVIPEEWRDISEEVSWSAPNSDGFFTIDALGNLSAIQASPAISVTARAAGIEANPTFVQVTDPVLESVNIFPAGAQRTLISVPQQFTCFGEYSGEGACTGADPFSCEITDIADFTSSDAGVFSVSNDPSSKGEGLALAAGTAQVNCSLDAVTSDPPADIRVCPDDAIDAVVVTPAEVSPLPVEGTVQLAAVAEYTDCLTDQPATLTVTDIANWSSADTAIATVSDTGQVTAIAPGTTQVVATFRGFASQTVVITVLDANLDRIEVSGPSAVAPGLELTAEYTAMAVFLDPDTGEELEPVDITDDTNTFWTSSNSASLAFIDENDGSATVPVDASPEVITVTATYLAVSDSVETRLLEYSIEDAEVVPDLVCLGEFSGDSEVQLESFGLLIALDENGNPVSCKVNATNASDWASEAGNTDIGCGTALLDNPTTVSNTVPNKGLVTVVNNLQFFGTGSSCISATLPGEDAQIADVYVNGPTGELQCNTGGASAPSSDPLCADAFAPAPEDGEEEAP